MSFDNPPEPAKTEQRSAETPSNPLIKPIQEQQDKADQSKRQDNDAAEQQDASRQDEQNTERLGDQTASDDKPADKPLVSSSSPQPLQPDKLNDDDPIIDTPTSRQASTQAPASTQANADQTPATSNPRPSIGGASVINGDHITCPVCAHQFDKNATRL